MRRDGPIPPLHKVQFPKRFIVFDTEAYRGPVLDGVETQAFRLGVLVYNQLTEDLESKKRIIHHFRSPEELASLIEWYTKKDNTLFVYAHNLKYDLQLSGLLTRLLSEGWLSVAFVLQDPPTFIRLKRNRQTIMFVDTFNYWQTSLARLGEQMKHDKLTMPDESEPDEAWFVYCQRDVEVLEHYLLEFMRFLDENDLAGLGLTLASQALRTFRHRFMMQEIMIHSRPEVLTLERDAYTGGRVEAWYIGAIQGPDLYKLDVNSMYPYVMRDNAFPVEFVSYTELLPLQRLKRYLETYYAIADVTLNTDMPVYPVRLKSKLIFPVGRFNSVLHGPELSFAYEHGHIQGIDRIAIYRAAPIFTEYTRFFYQLKLDAEKGNNPVLRHQAKIFLNSLYGKFGQREIVSKVYDNADPTQYGRLVGYSESLGVSVEVVYLGEQMEVRYRGGESAFSFPAIAGSVTAYARLYLWSLLALAGPNNVLYCDTDSLIVNLEGYQNLESKIDPSRLGYLKLEGVSDTLDIRGAKDYTFSGEHKHKGIPKSAVSTGPDSWEYWQFRGALTWLNQGLPEGVEVYHRSKQRKSLYDKGVVLESGRVIPHNLP